MADSEVNRRKVLKGAAAGSLAVAAAAAAGVAQAQPTTTTPPSGTTTPPTETTTPSGTTSAKPATTTPAKPTTSAPSAAMNTTATAPGAKRVAVLGGGVAGMTAAHELAERGFQVSIFEPRAWGGKARSMDTPLPVTNGRKPLPGEHGFRFFPGYYRVVFDTMERIPFGSNKNGVKDNLVAVPTAAGEQRGGNITIPFGFWTGDIGTALDANWLIDTLLGGMYWLPKLPYGDLVTFVRRLLVYFASSDERRVGQWEKTSFKDFAHLGEGSNETMRVLVSTLARTFVAAKEDIASTKTMCNQAENFLLNFLGRNNNGMHSDNALGGPTTETWIDPWAAQLKKLNVDMQLGSSVQALTVKDGKIASATIKDASGTKEVEADWFVVALPPDKVSALFNQDILKLDPSLGRIKELFCDWMTGIQFYLNTDVVESPGHIGWLESPWRMSGIHQTAHWKKLHPDIAKEYGDGSVKGILSVDISDWHTPGVQNKKAADQLSPEDVAKEAWYQITKTTDKIHANNLVGWFLDPGLVWNGSGYTNDDPLLINTAGSWDIRPESPTKIPNMFLAGDYNKTEIDLATMEGANEGGRMAANAILDASGSTSDKAKLWKRTTIKEFDGIRKQDAGLYKQGKPHIWDH
ncbi:putative oxidoreductase [Nocardia nova SH22a]|uniref:Putative oxidoreductase n=1 Tax=Nocardia nova SH22a TaxID=1415166 RepID=W5TM83_9NOCA|nr:FAD-dependent oxidoreductase [Nocardia nova]AHH20108.1 putative oxidoreductase [Nocardia nova SH22a]